MAVFTSKFKYFTVASANNSHFFPTNYRRGKWVNDQRHGKGVLKNSNGDTYDGEFCFGEMSGSGKYQFASGDSYIGESQIFQVR